MGFVNNEVAPRKLVEHVLFYVADFVCCNADMPLAIQVPLTWTQNGIGNRFTVRLVTMELDRGQSWSPPGELIHPVTQRALRDNNEVWPSAMLVLQHIHQDRNRLKRFSETHLYKFKYM